jgi:transcriptional regulator with XRE-family HTH domain
MTRVLFKKGQLDQYLSLCKAKMNMSLPQLAQIISVERHTLNDWRREKLLPNLEKLKLLAGFTNTPLPPILESKSDTWGSSKAGLIRQQKYGCTLSVQDRIRGGHNSQVNRHDNPEYYRKLGCPIPRDFIFPDHNNHHLAEFIGILLGDGGIQNLQLSITLNSVADSDYIKYVGKLIYELFQYSPTVLSRYPVKATVLLISGVNFISELLKIGMKVGDKVKQQVDVPDWIKSDPELSRWCLRGMMDTDGGVFRNTYIINGKSYSYLKICFSNLSQPLRHFAYKVLSNYNLSPSYVGNNQVWVASEKNVHKYMQAIGSSNERLHRKFR